VSLPKARTDREDGRAARCIGPGELTGRFLVLVGRAPAAQTRTAPSEDVARPGGGGRELVLLRSGGACEAQSRVWQLELHRLEARPSAPIHHGRV